ncbi:hypothetical protein FS595_06410 [Serratia rubidaea]|uniref:fimbrial protein n=1 Tax=Serratia rubidaea TaxID=61652 RepID=UPI001F22BBBD|nr:fimbrial protein [Serratia rubidaea]UJD79347.1 hypothetical protein FS596_06410 [Serratia rubidaea]UJD83901.1 hypothetical protein FS595_06410 [Serratia rubidaea]
MGIFKKGHTLLDSINKKKPIMQLAALSLFFLMTGYSHAYCNARTGAVSGSNGTGVRPINFGSFNVPSNAVIGDVIKADQIGVADALCFSGETFTTSFVNGGTPVPGISNVYSTNIDGIGIRVTHGYGSTAQHYVPSTPSIDGNRFHVDSIYVELIKTANNIKAGTLSGRVAQFVATRDYATFVSVDATIMANTCTLTTPTINVPMGTVRNTEFSGIGSVTSNKPFDISLDCDANANVNITFDATSDPSGADGVMALNSIAPGGTASGVGIQLLHNNTPVKFGTLLPVANTVVSGPITIPLVARYYQTASAITAGQANGTATFTMTYN